MHRYYKDILDRIVEPPTWFDDYGVPRFGDVSPRQLGNSYASEAALVLEDEGLEKLIAGAPQTNGRALRGRKR
jgi:hypothetical protein